MAPTGEINLQILLASMDPLLHEPTYHFYTFPSETPIHSTLAPILTFTEPEGTTVIAPSPARDPPPGAQMPSRMITLRVHSSLEAVGFMAVVAKALASKGVPCNAVSAFWHDHLFVPMGKEEDAMDVLREVVEEAKKQSAAA